VLLLVLSLGAALAAEEGSLLARLEGEAQGLRPEVLAAALERTRCGIDRGQLDGPHHLAVVDFDLPSTARRLWLFDLQQGELVLNTWVTHGSGTGEDLALTFSNVRNSHQSSPGLFRGAETYIGKHGLSLRLDGLDPGINDRARERDIVIHGADYARESHIAQFGRLGRSQGCPAVSPELAPVLIERLAEGGAVFVWTSHGARAEGPGGACVAEPAPG